jgi:hypothetical protein
VVKVECYGIGFVAAVGASTSELDFVDVGEKRLLSLSSAFAVSLDHAGLAPVQVSVLAAAVLVERIERLDLATAFAFLHATSLLTACGGRKPRTYGRAM